MDVASPLLSLQRVPPLICFPPYNPQPGYPSVSKESLTRTIPSDTATPRPFPCLREITAEQLGNEWGSFVPGSQRDLCILLHRRRWECRAILPARVAHAEGKIPERHRKSECRQSTVQTVKRTEGDNAHIVVTHLPGWRGSCGRWSLGVRLQGVMSCVKRADGNSLPSAAI